ncbi:hypothetical protein [Streptomyces sp. NPDC021020]|uniref:hypothetical protein n=1 Tax=Streptomyces sp. NPDC021020 TaxID=3365109 RepID=UPI0037B47C17
MLAQLAANCHQGNCTGHIDNTPAYFIFGGIGAVMLIGIAFAAGDSASRHRIMTRGVAATAEIVKVAPRNFLRDGMVRLDLTLAVTPPDGEAFEVETDHTFPITDLPKAGWTLPVRYREENHYRVLVSGEPVPPDSAAEPAP